MMFSNFHVKSNIIECIVMYFFLSENQVYQVFVQHCNNIL